MRGFRNHYYEHDFRSKRESIFEPFKITKQAYTDLVSTVGQQAPETGGPLFGSRKDYVVQHFVFDKWGSRSHAAYDPDIEKMNEIVTQLWKGEGLELLGWCHSHPRGIDKLSGPDLAYIEKFFHHMPDLSKFLTPIVHSSHDGPMTIFPYIAYPNRVRDYQLGSLKVVEDQQYPRQKKRNSKPKLKPLFNGSILEDKLGNAVDVEGLKKTKIFAVGNGGANRIYENFIRVGIGHLSVMDFDKVDTSNLVTQGWYSDQIGTSKVEALKQTISRLIPEPDKVDERITCLEKDFLELSDKELIALAKDADLLMFMTDDFHAQARGNRLALKLKKPAIFAMMYENAHCSEVGFTIPGVTPACYRCAVSSRYDDYINNGFENNIGSQGSLIFQTEALNTVIGLLTLAILHNDKPEYEFGEWFGKHWDQNFLQTRISPKYQDNFFDRIFGKEPRAVCFDSLWQKIEPEAPPKYHSCPDCGGKGDLRKAKIKHTKLECVPLKKAS